MRLAILALVLVSARVANAAPDPSARLFDLLESSRLEEARALVDAERDRGGLGPLLIGAYDFYRGAYAEATHGLDAGLASLEPRFVTEAKSLRELAHAVDEVTHGFVARRSEHFEIKVAAGKDELLAEPALDALERAWSAIGDDLGEKPPGPIRVEVYGKISDLAKVSPLTIAEIETSGTIALCKYNRLMITSPRALVAGYPWLDTLAHELTHYLVSRASRNTVPIWLHEGIAKTEERRWREPFGGPMPLLLEHLLASGLRDQHLIPFSAMHPSMAKLPSQEDAGLAFAEVASAIRYLTQDRGPAALRKLLSSLRDGNDLNRAIAGVTGQSFAAFERSWRDWLKSRGLKTHPELGMGKLRFKDDKTKNEEEEEDPTAKEAHSPAEARARGLVRIGTLLRTRGRLAAAAAEYQRAEGVLGAGHPAVAGRLGRTYLELKQWDRAIAAARPGIARRPDSAGLQVTVGRALLEKGDSAAAQPFLEGALAVNPYDRQTRCGLERVYRARSDPRLAREANACAQLGGAQLGGAQLGGPQHESSP